MPTILLLLFTTLTCFAQDATLPFEFERELAAHYQAQLSAADQDHLSEKHAVNHYMLAYKQQRASQPGSYFVSPNATRNKASEYLRTNFPNQSGLALVNFLEHEGDLESCAALLERPSSLGIVLPYKYLAAYLLQRNDEAQEIMNEMLAKGLISEIMKAFGENAVMSFQDSKFVVSQGFQDFVAIQYGLQKGSRSMTVHNYFLEQCKAYSGERISGLLQKENISAWVTPTVTPQFYTENIAKLWVSGIGMQYLSGPNPNPELAERTLSNVGMQFKGLKLKPQSPADSGLIRSYGAFAKSFSDLAISTSNQEETKQAKKINAYTAKNLDGQ